MKREVKGLNDREVCEEEKIGEKKGLEMWKEEGRGNLSLISFSIFDFFGGRSPCVLLLCTCIALQ